MSNFELHPILFESQNRSLTASMPNQQTEFRDNFVGKQLPEVEALEKYNIQRSSLIDDVKSKQGKLYQENITQKTYFKDTLKGIHNCNIFSELYYSQKNIDNLQNMIIHSVFKQTNDTISRQHDNELLIVMRSTYLQHSKNPVIEDLNDQKQVKILKEEISRLNNIVLNYIIPDIVSQILQYKRYIIDITQNNIPIPRQINPSIKGTKEFRDIKEIMNMSLV